MRHRLYGDTPSKCKWGHARKWAIMSPILIRSTWSTPICLSDAPKHMLSAVNMAENQLGIPKADVEAIKASFAPGKIFRFLQFKENFMKPLPSTNISTYTLFTYIMYMTVYITKVIYWILSCSILNDYYFYWWLYSKSLLLLSGFLRLIESHRFIFFFKQHF